MIFTTILLIFIMPTSLALPLVPHHSLHTICSLHGGIQSHNKLQVFA